MLGVTIKLSPRHVRFSRLHGTATDKRDAGIIYSMGDFVRGNQDVQSGGAKRQSMLQLVDVLLAHHLAIVERKLLSAVESFGFRKVS